MNKTKIEWTDYTWNPVTGCDKRCTFGSDSIKCYAYKMALRLRGRCGYPKDDPFKPTFHPNRVNEPRRFKKPRKIFVCSMGDFYSEGINVAQRSSIFEVIRVCSWHTFQILTKQYHKLPHYTYPKNVWLGISVTEQSQTEGIPYLLKTDAEIKFISFEPLTEKIDVSLRGIDWIIIGARTNPLKLPKPKWVNNILKEAFNLRVPIFLKDNLAPLYAKHLHHLFAMFKEFPVT